MLLKLLILFSLCLRPVITNSGTSDFGEFTCQANGDVYFRPLTVPSNRRARETAEILYVQSGGDDCKLAVETDRVRIHDCHKAQSCPVTLFIKDEKSDLYFATLSCNHGNSQAPDGSACSSDVDGVGKSIQRRQADDTERNIGSYIEATSVIFSVQLVFNSNDEILYDCDPDGYGNLYVSNPEPEVLKSVLAFSGLSRERCQVTPLDYGNTVAVGNCDLAIPVIVAFSAREAHNGIIGGNSSFFRVYKIDCFLDGSPAWGNIDVSVKGGSDVTTEVRVLSVVIGLLATVLS